MAPPRTAPLVRKVKTRESSRDLAEPIVTCSLSRYKRKASESAKTIKPKSGITSIEYRIS